MTTPQQYRKKPVVVEAMPWNGTTAGATPIIDWVTNAGGTANYHCLDEMGCSGTDLAHMLMIRTLEGTMTVSPGDYVIRGVKGEFYPCKPDIFASTYGPAVERARPGSVRRMLDTYQRSLDTQVYGSAQTVMECVVEDLRQLVEDPLAGLPLELDEETQRRVWTTLGELYRQAASWVLDPELRDAPATVSGIRQQQLAVLMAAIRGDR